MEGADLHRAHLEEAILRGAHLRGPVLAGAHLEGAHLDSEKSPGVDMPDASGLTREQLEQAILDAKTRLPSYLADRAAETESLRPITDVPDSRGSSTVHRLRSPTTPTGR